MLCNLIDMLICASHHREVIVSVTVGSGDVSAEAWAEKYERKSMLCNLIDMLICANHHRDVIVPVTVDSGDVSAEAWHHRSRVAWAF